MTPEQMRDASLMELFALEAEAQTAVLSAGLLALERNPGDPAQLEACMRAAHSLKGAARIVGVDAGVQVAHVMEDCLVAAQAGDLRLGPEHIDALLQGTDLLLRIGMPHKAPAAEDISAFLGQIKAAVEGAPAALASPLEAPVVGPEPAPMLQPSLTPALVDEPSGEPTGARRSGEGERVLRVTAERLNALLDLASKAMVETQRLKPYLASLQRLKRMQAQGLRALDELQQRLDAQLPVEDVRQALAQAKTLLGDTQQILLGQVAELDDYGWEAGQRAQQLYDTALACRMRPFADVLGGQARMVRDLGRSLGKQVRLEVEGEKTQVDRDVLERLEGPLMHLLRNAVDHGIE